MKKEVLIAVVTGLILGLIITMGIFTANRSINQQRVKKQLQQSPAIVLPPSENNTKTLNLTSHESFDLLDESDIKLSGVAWTNAVIALITETDTQLIQADEEGIFVFSVRLIKGFNEITLVATDETGFTQSLNLVLTYSTTQLDQPISWFEKIFKPAYAQESVTDKIKERLQDTAEENLVDIKEQLTTKSTAPRKKAYIGKISTIDNDSLVLSYKDKEYPTTLNQDTVYTRGSAAIDRQDLDINDFVIILGWYDGQAEKFSAVKVNIIDEPEAPTNRQLLQGKISEIDGSKITVNNKSLIVAKNTGLAVIGVDDPTTEDLALNDNLFAIVTLDSNGNIDEVNQILVLPGKNNPAGLVPTNVIATQSATPAADNAE